MNLKCAHFVFDDDQIDILKIVAHVTDDLWMQAEHNIFKYR